jgi:hypothetical protein
MDRLTSYINFIRAGNLRLDECAREELLGYLEDALAGERVLRKYQDLGTLEQLAALKQDNERYRQAEAEGRLVVLPCPINTPVWQIFIKSTGWSKARGGNYTDYEIREARFEYYMLPQHRPGIGGFPTTYGETIFLTHAEAEAALAAKGDLK